MAANKKILLVDDDFTLADMYSERLEASGYSVVISHDGESGLAAAQKEKPDIILLDIMMPKMNGLDVAKTLREDPELAKTPIIFLTALIQDTDKKQVSPAENDDYCVKSETTPKELVEKIEALLGNK